MVYRLSVLMLVALFCWGCWGGGEAPAPVVVPVESDVVSSGVQRVELAPAELTRAASERSRVRAEHATLIASIPTPTLPPSRSVLDESDNRVSGLSRGDPSVGPAPIAEPSGGVWWYREGRGDFRPNGMRGSNAYWRLFSQDLEGLKKPHFVDGSIYPVIGRKLASEVEEIVPELGDGNQALLSRLTLNMAWELASESLPLIRVWSKFDFTYPDEDEREYRVGGVLSLGVSDQRDPGTGELLFQYLVVGDFQGPVLVERVR